MATTYRKEMESKILDDISNMLEELPDYVYLYILHIQFTTTPQTRINYLRDIKLYLEYIYDTHEDYTWKNLKSIPPDILADLDETFISGYLAYLAQYKKNGVIYTNENASIRRKLSSLRNLYAYLYENNKIKANPITKVKLPKLPKKEVIKMDLDESRDLLNVVEGGTNLTDKQLIYHDKLKLRDLAIVSLLLSTGIRVSECVGLDISDVDFKHSSVKVIRKGNKEEIVYFSDETSGILREYVEYRNTLPCLEGHENALFLSSQKKRIGVRAVEILVKKYSQIATPLKKITPHKLRSTFGTALYEETSDLYLVSEYLGHSSVETTKIYVSQNNKRKAASRNKVNY